MDIIRPFVLNPKYKRKIVSGFPHTMQIFLIPVFDYFPNNKIFARLVFTTVTRYVMLITGTHSYFIFIHLRDVFPKLNIYLYVC